MGISAVYKIENTVTGDIYIGQTINYRKRVANHFWHLNNKNHRNNHLQSAFNKYGRESFLANMLVICEPIELTYYEQEMVNRLNPKYNICKECVDSNFGLKMSEEAKTKISISHKGKVFSEEHRKNLSLSRMGEKNPGFGKHHAEETKRKISLAQTGKKNHQFGKTTPEEVKTKISSALSGENSYRFGKHFVVSEEVKRNMSIARTGEKNHFYGKHHSEETKKKIADKLRGEKSWRYGTHPVCSEEKKRKLSDAANRYYQKKKLEEAKNA